MFASKAQKEEKDYRYLTDILKSSDMDTTGKIETQIKKVMSRAFYASIVMLAFIVALCVLSPKYLSIWGIIGVMCFAWIWRSAIVAKRLMYRYIKEEINKDNNVDAKEE